VTPEEALRLIEQGEGQRVEFKKSLAEENQAIDALCAFANADGGTVFFGVRNDRTIVGVSVGVNTLEELANRIARPLFPQTIPRIDELSLDGKTIVAVTVDKAAKGRAVFTGPARVRSGRANLQMSWDQVKARILEGEPGRSDQRDRPGFEVTYAGVGKPRAIAEPRFRVKQTSGENIADLEWRVRGQFVSEWRQASGSALDRTSFIPALSLPEPSSEDQRVGRHEIGFEIRFDWQGEVRHEIHRWRTPRPAASTLSDWGIEEKILPALYFEEAREVHVFFA
jgi:Putative DNA-binding domain